MSVRFEGGGRRRVTREQPGGDPRAPRTTGPTETVLELISRHVVAAPASPALDDGATVLSYAELWARSGALGARLVAAGVVTGTPVVVSGPRSAAFATAMVAVLRAGGVVVPCAASLPPARADGTASAAAAGLVVAIGDVPCWAGAREVLVIDDAARPRDGVELAPLDDADRAGTYATVYCTSGTTGSMRSVRNTHLVVRQHADWMQQAFALSSGDRMSVVTSLSAVASSRMVLGALALGATAVFAPEDLLPEDGLAWAADARVSVLHLTPTRARSWIDDAPAGGPRPALRWTFFAGEPLTSTVVQDWRAAVGGEGRIACIWGTTEVGGSRSWYVVPEEPRPGRQPIGRPIPHTQLFLLDADDRLCAPGIQGEIVVRSTSIADGYGNDPEATAARFVANPLTGDPADLVFRTGDLGRFEPDGTLLHEGRIDDQLCIGGARVEPAEVASRLVQHPAVRAAHVQAVTGADRTPELVAFIATVGGHAPAVALPASGTTLPVPEQPDESAAWRAELRRWCSSELPAVAVPARYVLVDELPTTPLGKVDRQALLSLIAAIDPPEGDPRPDPRARLEEPEGCLLDDLEACVAARADDPAVDDGVTRLTYRELWARSGRVARGLQAAGAGPGARVMVATPRNASFAVAMVAVLRAGAVAVPCAAMLPAARCAAMAEAATATHVVCAGDPPAWAADLVAVDVHGEHHPDEGELPTPGEHAVIFFTSGTTGVPKAVLGRHPSIAHYLRWWREAFGVRPGDRVAMATSTAFDVTLRNLFGPLTAGATVCVAPDDLLPEDGLAWLGEQAVSVLHVTPSLATSWLAEAPTAVRDATRALRWTLFAGEMLTDSLVRSWREANPGAIGNMYGPTETTMSRCLYVVPDEPVRGPQPVGHPLPGTQMLVVDEHDRLCEIGEPGEVLVRTRTGTAGYCNNAEEQARRFVPNPFTGDPDDLVYRTGDVGTYRFDGSLVLRGRVDDQVKIGGVRVEPAEVTATMLEHPDVRAACVAVRTDERDGTPSLVAFVVAATGDHDGLRAALRRHCGEHLAPAAVPGRVVVVDRLPTTPNGKVDRARLLAELDADERTPSDATGEPAPDGAAPADAAAPTFGLDDLVQVWREVLRRDDVEAGTNFFDAGGTSVAAVRLAQRVRTAVGRKIALADLFVAQTPRELAVLLELPGTERSAGETKEAAAQPVHRRIARYATERPRAVALHDGDAPLTYAELDARVEAAAQRLVAAGVRPGSLVAIHARRTSALVPVLLAVHRCGAGYVPVDPDLPSARVAFLLADSASRVVVTDRPLPPMPAPPTAIGVDELQDAVVTGAAPVDVEDDPERTAYVIYTSGSTGNPKGVLVPQRALSAFVDAATAIYGVQADDRLLQYHSLSFDTSVEEIFCTLGAGATLVVPAAPMLGSAGWFLEEIDRLGITVLDLPTSFWHGLVDDMADAGLALPAALRTVIIGGSAASPAALARWNAGPGAAVRLINAYGPTEVTIAATAADLTGLVLAPGEATPIGRPFPGVHAVVVDEQDRPVPAGASGELLLGGAQLATGYLDRPELTAARFVIDPTGRTGARYYRTGDRVRELSDGQFVFEARVDDQVKVRGYRIELGEVEAAIASHPAVREAVAMVEGDGSRLVAHVALRDGATVTVDELRAHAATALPSYAVPARIDVRAEIPRTPGGKPDRRALRSARSGPLGAAQEQQWFLHCVDPESPAYNVTVGLRLQGPLDVDALDLSLRALVERHEALRSRYVEDGDGVVQIVDEPVARPATRVDLTDAAAGCDDAGRRDVARATMLDLAAEPFDLSRDAMFRASLLRLATDDHVLCLRSHHIALDGWSVDVLVGELMAAYDALASGRSVDLPAVEVQPLALALAERERERTGALDAALDHWASLLVPPPPPLALPLDRPRPATREPLGAVRAAPCERASASQLGALARELRTTPFAIGLTLFGQYLAARCGADDLVIGVPSADRDEPGADRTVGMLVNTLPHRATTAPGETVRSSVARTAMQLRDMLAHKHAPFDRIVRRVAPPRVAGMHPVFQVTFQTANGPRHYGTAAGVTVSALPTGRNGAKFDISCDLVTAGTLECRLTFAGDVFDDETMQELTDGFARFVDAALADLDRPVDAVVADARATRMHAAARAALVAPPATAAPAGAEQAGPPAAMLDAVVAAFGRVLGTTVGPDDDFFRAGGHSLLAVRLCSAIERELGERLSVATVFECPTPRGVAARLAGEATPATTAPEVASPAPPVAAPVAAAPVVAAPAPPVPAPVSAPAPATGSSLDRPARLWLTRAPMSFAQRRVWLLERLGVAEGAYLLTSTYELFGELDIDRFRAAMHATAMRHEVLRTRFVAGHDDLAEQLIDDHPQVSLTVLDLRDEALADDEVHARIRAVAQAPFDLEVTHAWRAVLARLDDGHTLLSLTVHHIATDGESQGILVRDLAAAYSAAGSDAPTLPPPALQYADHAVWQHAQVASGALAASLEDWLRRFDPMPEPLELPARRPRPAVVTGAGADVEVAAGPALAARVEAFARANGTTTFAVLLAAYQLLLHRITDRADITVGIPVTERSLDADAGTVGFYVNTVPVRTELPASGTAGDALRATQQALVRSIEHAQVPLELVLDRLALSRDPAASPLVQTMFSVQAAGGDVPRMDGLRVSRRRIGTGGTAKFDLSLIALHGESLDLVFEYRTDVFDRAEVAAWASQYLVLLDALLDDPSRPAAELPLMDRATEAWLVEACNRTATPYPRDASVTDLFAAVVHAHADRVAVVEGERATTYATLDECADRLATRLHEAGTRPGDRVALSMGRSTELVVAMLATLRCGAAYVPIDPAYPEARRASMVELASAVVTVGHDGMDFTIAVHDATGATGIAGDGTPAGAAAYVMFTSGSTGTPKGVVVPHRGIVRLVRDTDYVDFGDDLVVAHLSNTSFDAATFEIWGALLHGARLVVLDTDTITSPAAFAEAIRSHGITTMFVTTALFNVVAREVPDAFAPLRDLLFGGEAADADAVRLVLAHGRPHRLANVYGPTESTTFASRHLVERLDPRATTVPIGRPIANTTLHVVDGHGRPVPPLQPGELVIGGDGPALGYLGDEALTATKFVPDPFSSAPGARLYRTGDIVRRRLDGAIEFVGRKDHQVKVRGFRIELGEIEAALRRFDGVRQVFATTHRSANGDTSVLAYVVPDGVTLDGGALRAALRDTLPAYLTPDAVLPVTALPLNANGKVDRAALPLPGHTCVDEPVVPAVPSGELPVAPPDPLTRELCALWCRVLERDHVGPDDNFFDLGGTSVRAVRLFAAIERQLGTRLALSQLLEAPTVRLLGDVLRAHGAHVARAAGIEAADPSSGDEDVFVTLRAGCEPRRAPLHLVHPAGGQLFVYAPLLPALPDDLPVIGIRELGWDQPSRRLATVEAYAAHYAHELARRQPTGPLRLGGYSLGGLIAYEMAQLLTAAGRQVDLVVLLDASPVAAAGTGNIDVVAPEAKASKLRRRFARDGIAGVVRAAGRVAERKIVHRVAEPASAARDALHTTLARHRGRPVDPLVLGRESERAGLELRARYRPAPYGGRVVYVRALGTDPDFPIPDHAHRWIRLVDRLEIVDVPGNHANQDSMMHPPHAAVVGRRLAELLDAEGGRP